MHDLIDYLRATLDAGGSDLHLSVGTPPSARIHGKLVPLSDAPLAEEDCRDLVYSGLSEIQRATLEKDWEIDFALAVDQLGRFRGNAHHVRGRVEAAFRFIPEDIPELESLGHGQAVEDLCMRKEGLVLVTGITGSGKSTTLAAMVRHISEHRPCVVITIEDPIEFVFPPGGGGIIKQRQVGDDTRAFPNALRAALRQDPDVILVSEMRDLDTIRTGITAAETGHLVLATLHTQDAPRTIDRLVDVFPPEQQGQILAQLANCLAGIISQKLLPRADHDGRVLASEILVSNHAVRTCIRERKWQIIPGLMQVGSKEGMHTFDASLTHLAQGGYILDSEAIAHARDPRQVTEDLEKFRAMQQRAQKKKGFFG